MTLECLIYEKEENIAIIQLNRPHVLNAMNNQLWLELTEILQDAKTDENIKVVIITGVGRGFSTGADLKESKDRTLQAYKEYLIRLQKISRDIINYPKPIIAGINGYALGSGIELALACDIRIAAKSAKLGFPETNVSASITGGTMRLLQDLIGIGKAKELLYTAEYIDGVEAEAIGLVNKVVDDDKLMEEVKIMAKRITQNSQLSIRLIKKGLNMVHDLNMEKLMNYEVEACLETVATPERQDKLNEFQERKKK